MIIFIVYETAILGQEACEVDSKSQFSQAVSACNCADITSDACELKLQGITINCKPGASQGCKDSVNGWANAYKNVANPESCKESAIAANGC